MILFPQRLTFAVFVLTAFMLAAFALCVTANRLLSWAVWWMVAIVLEVTSG